MVAPGIIVYLALKLNDMDDLKLKVSPLGLITYMLDLSAPSFKPPAKLM